MAKLPYNYDLTVVNNKFNLLNSIYRNFFQSFLWNCAVFVVAFLSFATYSMMDTNASRLTAETAFVSLAIFNNMRSLFRMLPRENKFECCQHPMTAWIMVHYPTGAR